VGKLNQGRDYLRVGGRHGLCQSRSALPKGRRPARIVSEVATTKGGYARSRRRTVIGLDQRLRPTPRKCGRERSPSCAARL
jgi:hypothetical protein